MIRNLAIANFRNFDSVAQIVGPLSKVNLFIGKNNSGKSNVLRYIRDILPEITGSRLDKRDALPVISKPNFPDNVEDVLYFAVTLDEEQLTERFGQDAQNLKEMLAQSEHYDADKEVLIFKLEPNDRARYSPKIISNYRVERRHHEALFRIWRRMRSMTGGAPELWYKEVLESLCLEALRPMDVLYVPAFRQIDTRLPEFSKEYREATDENHIIDELAKIASPDYTHEHLKGDFNRLVTFLRDLTEDNELDVEIPNSKKTINVRQNGKLQPIEALGSGIHELFILAAKVVLNPKALILIEEPEVHMHPSLQRKFVNFLLQQEGSQFFLSTHSAHIIDIDETSVFEVTKISGRGKIRRLLTGTDRRDACHSLGYRPSDLLQSNCVIWVEGPSDRIYLNHWISACAHDLREGIDYSIMFYGGKLLSHLTAQDAGFVEEFIRLLPINRRICLLMDRDTGPDDEIRQTKLRVQSELIASKCIPWVTFGREVENYVRPEVRVDAVKCQLSNVESCVKPNDPYSAPLRFRSKEGEIAANKIDKIRFAKRVSEIPADLDFLDLRQRISEVCDYIRQSSK